MNLTLKKSFFTTLLSSMLVASAAHAQTPAQTSPKTPAQKTAPTAPPKSTPAKADAKNPATKSKTNACKPEKGMNVKVKLTTSMGAMTLELNEEKAPISSANFIKYVQSGHYDGTIFHRVISNFMIQGGGFTKDMQQKSVNASIKNESTNGLKNDLYTVAMARTNVRDSATSQFFINVKNNDFLNYTGEQPSGHGYAVFGKIIEGMDIVDKMKAVRTATIGPHGDVPVETITIEKAECL